MKRVFALLLLALFASVAVAQDDTDVIDTDAIPDFDPVTTGVLDDEIYQEFFEESSMVDVNQTYLADTLLVDDFVDWDDWEVTSEYMKSGPKNMTNLQAIGFTITVADITAALSKGGSNPIEKLIISKILEAMNKAGITIKGGALVLTMTNGPNIPLASGCSADVHLEGGWGAQAVLKPASSLTVSMSLNDLTLVIKTLLHADTNFGMSGHIKARIGKKIFGKCIRIGKGLGVTVGADMVLDIDTQLAIKPTLAMQDGKLVIKFQPTIWVGGKLISFNPRASASFTIFGIHIRFIESKIKSAITTLMQKTITPGRVQDELAKLQVALQTELNRIFAGIVVPLPDLVQGSALYTQVNSAVTNIKQKQF
jgi:hypothetical protein